MQKRKVLLLGTLAVLPLCSFGVVNVDFSSGKFSSDGQHMETGKNGHAQAALDAQGSLIRFGSNTQADVGNEREVTLTKGLLLVSSGEGFLRRSGVVIHTPEGNVTVRGTVLVAVLPDGAVKLTCLEGGVRGDLGGHGVSLHPGELIIQRGDGTRDIVQVNLHSLASTCALLVGGGFKPLQFAGSIDKAVVQQDKVFAAEHHHFAGQHVAGVAHVEAPSFLAYLFSGHGNSANNFGSSVSTSSGPSTTSIAGGTLTISAGDRQGNTFSVGAVLAGDLTLSSNTSALIGGSSFQGLTFNGSSGASVVFNNNFNSSGLTISGANIVSGASSVGVNANSFINTNAVGTLSLGNTVGATLSGVTNNLNVINLSNAPGTLTLSPGGEPTITYNGQVYHGQDALNLINNQQHPTTPSTP